MPASNFATEGDADYEKRLDEQWDTQKAVAGNMMDENKAMQDLANYVQAHAPSDPLAQDKQKWAAAKKKSGGGCIIV